MGPKYFWISNNRNMKKVYITSLILIITALNGFASSLADALKIRISGNGSNDETVIRFLPNCSPNYDSGYDAMKLFSSANVPFIFTKIIANNTSLSINAQPALTGNFSIPLYMKVPATGSFTLLATELGPFAGGIKIVIEDQETHTYSDLRTQPSYTFNVADHTIFNNGAPRFTIHFFMAPQIVSVENALCTGTGLGTAIISNPNAGSKGYKVINTTTGQTVFTADSTHTTDTLSTLTEGDYSAIVEIGQAIEASSTFSIAKEGMPVADFTVPSTVAFVNNPIQFNNMSTNFKVSNWDLGDGSSSTSFSPTHSFSAAGTYTVTLYVTNGACFDSTSKMVDVSSVTSTIETTEEKLIVTINDKNFSFASSETGNTVRLFESSGKLVSEMPINNFQRNIDISSALPAGIYILNTGNSAKTIILN